MAFKDLAEQKQGIQLLQRSLERGRLGHAYLFTGSSLDELELVARNLAKTLNCLQPVKGQGGAAIDCCDACLNCRKIEHGTHADVHWIRPESKLRVVRIEQLRELIQEINLKPTEAQYKIAVVVAADRMNTQAANAFLKTLEEPPPRSVLLLLATEPQRLLETIVSRCLRLNFALGARRLSAAEMEWLAQFSRIAALPQKSLLARYRLLDILVQKLTALKESIEGTLSAKSPLEQYEDVDKDLREKWEKELAAGIEAEYRRQRAHLLMILQDWLRDVWLRTMKVGNDLLNCPDIDGGSELAKRITPEQALRNLQIIESTQRQLHTNVQEALALEVCLLRLHL